MNYAIALAAGVLIGLFYYGGLWFTVRGLLSSRHPVMLTLSSFWLRTVLVLAAFLLVMQGRWQNAVACLAGFAAGRMIVSLLLPRCGGSRCT